MSIIYKNIIASTITDVAKVSDKYTVKSLLICNTSGVTAAIDLKLEHYVQVLHEDASSTALETYHILKNVNINSGVTLTLNEDELKYDSNIYHLKIYSTQIIDIIIK